MPIYEYQCPQCHAVFEEWLSVRDADAKNTAPCPHCESISPHIISNTAFVLKGGGWYVTEYKNRPSSSQEDGHGASQNSEQEAKKEQNTGEKTPTSPQTPAKNSGDESTAPHSASPEASAQNAPVSSTKQADATRAAAS